MVCHVFYQTNHYANASTVLPTEGTDEQQMKNYLKTAEIRK